MQTWRIGDVTITKIVELESCGGAAWILPDAVPEACREISWLKPDFMDEAGELKFSVHALVIETKNQLIVVDTCVGNEKERMPYKDWHHLQTTLSGGLHQRRLRPCRRRLRAVYASTCRSRGLEHHARRWKMGADIS